MARKDRDKAPEAREYEFDGAQNVLIGELAAAMRFVGNVSIGLAILLAAAGAAAMTGRHGGASGVATLVQAAVVGVVGFWTRGAAASFQSVVDTTGNDIAHLMGALRELRRLYNLQRYALIFALVVGGIAIGFVVFGLAR